MDKFLTNEHKSKISETRKVYGYDHIKILKLLLLNQLELFIFSSLIKHWKHSEMLD